jgi:predicted enzyme related to lactoylglutathione lyase
MEILGIFAVACVSDMERSVEWYARLIGRAPDDRPMEGLVQWRSSNGAGLQLVLDVEKSGSSLITIVTPVMDLARKRLAAASLQLEPDIRGDFGIVAQISDPDGNRLTLAEPPKGM